MSSLASMLPAPRGQYQVYKDDAPSKRAIAKRQAKAVPPYGRRQGFVPRSVEDFGDGGAFPEIHVAQYPLLMGKPGQKKSTAIVQVDAEGRADYDAILMQGRDKDQHVQSKFTDLVEVRKSEDELQRPGLEEEIETANRTRAALEKLVNRKISMARPVTVPENANANTKKAQYLRYTPAGGVTSGTNSGAKQRIIRLVETPVDPLEPPKYKHTKVPRGPPSPPVPVMHSPPRKITAADQKKWTIPPCVSNWKNAKGYTIPLDKRLAADGRSLQEAAINDKFAKVAQALHIAQQQSREAVALRAKVQKRIGVKQKEQVEEELRKMAAEARAQRAGILMGDKGGDSDTSSGSDSDDSEASDAGEAREAASGTRNARKRRRSEGSAGSRSVSRSRSPVRREREDPAAVEARRQRDRLRRERRKERERDLRMQKLGKKTKTLRDADRDISEKIALGLHTAGKGGGDMFDARLFNQSEGLNSGFGADDNYDVYSKPLFAEKKHSMYRPKKGDPSMYGGNANADEEYNKLRDTTRFKPGKDFEGVDRSAAPARRNEPVQFEKVQADESGVTGDAFDVDGITSGSAAKNPLASVGGGGTLRASGGGGITEGTGARAGTSRIAFKAGEGPPKMVLREEAGSGGGSGSGRGSRDDRRRRSRSRSPRRHRSSRRSRSRSHDRHRRSRRSRSRSNDRRRRR